ncbi:hypothetical protein B4U79_01011, partial [Dinothrombium tinctorium]
IVSLVEKVPEAASDIVIDLDLSSLLPSRSSAWVQHTKSVIRLVPTASDVTHLFVCGLLYR